MGIGRVHSHSGWNACFLTGVSREGDLVNVLFNKSIHTNKLHEFHRTCGSETRIRRPCPRGFAEWALHEWPPPTHWWASRTT